MTDPYVGPVAKSSGTGNLPIRRIVIHCTVGADATNAMSTVKYFKSSAAGGSAHAVIDQNETLICAKDNVICWHAPPNSHSYGIELCCSLSNKGQGHWDDADHVAMMKRGAKLTAEKCLEHSIPRVKLSPADLRAGKKGICGHIDVSNAFGQSSHWDPGPYFPWTQFMGYVRAYYEELTNPAPATDPEPEEDPMSAFTAAQLSKMMYDANAKYGGNLWAAPTGTGTALIRTVGAIAGAVSVLGTKVDALAKQISDEDLADDAELAAQLTEVDAALAGLKTATDLMAAELEELNEEPELPKA